MNFGISKLGGAESVGVLGDLKELYDYVQQEFATTLGNGASKPRGAHIKVVPTKT